MIDVKYSSKFKKDFKACVKRDYNMALLKQVIDTLRIPDKLPAKNEDHKLLGDYSGYRECQGVRFECAASVPHLGRPPYGILPLLPIGCLFTGRPIRN